MTDPSYYQTKFYLSDRDARRAASYAMASVARGVRYDPDVIAVRCVQLGGRQWTARATWELAKVALRLANWTHFRMTRSVGYGWWCLCWVDGMAKGGKR